MKIQLLLCCFIGSVSFTYSQNLEAISGIVIGKDDIENIHVINKTSKRFTTTNSNGEFFIDVKLHDTITFTAIQYTTQEIIIDKTILANKKMSVFLNEEINKLQEVIVGKVLTGNLMLDIGNSTVEPEINFYDVGIPGYKGKRATQIERRLNEARSGTFNAIVNGISGRTKILKAHVALEKNDILITKIRQRLSYMFFSEHPLSEFKQMDFWYFCSESLDFEDRCKGSNDVDVLEYLNEKYIIYIKNIKSE